MLRRLLPQRFLYFTWLGIRLRPDSLQTGHGDLQKLQEKGCAIPRWFEPDIDSWACERDSHERR